MYNPSLISVIVPVYNVEKYLCRCLDSLINQTYKNLEIILVDDGSPDNCPLICDDYAKKDNRIKALHKNNGGLSDARNAGMELAKGDLICFIDSDDYISLDFFEILYSTMLTENSDIIECSVVKFYEDNHFDDYKDDNKITTYETQEALSNLISENPFRQHVWNKLYKAELVLDIPFAVGKLNEDEFWTYQVFGRAKRITKLNKTMYYYFQRESSIMGERYNIRRLDALEGKFYRQKYIFDNYPSLESEAKVDMFSSCIFSCQSVMKFLNKKDKRIAKKIIKRYVAECSLSKKEFSLLVGKNKFWFAFANKSFFLCCKIRCILGVGF